ncbi:MAG: anoctamin [Streptococcus sp.]|nr:anoctamin [Streptococcus sp.]
MLKIHKYQHTYENSIVNKIFLFSFVNSNVGLCYTAFY